MKTIQDCKDFLSEKKTAIKLKQQEIEELESKISAGKELHSQLQEVLEVINTTGVVAQKQVKDIMEELVTDVIQSVFGPEYKFVVDNTVRSNRPETFFYVEKNGLRHTIEDEHGGSLAVLIAFALRVIICVITEEDIRKTIILDEPLKDADKRKLVFLGEMIKQLTDSLGVQFIMVTHEEQLIAAADRAFRVSQENAISSVEVIK